MSDKIPSMTSNQSLQPAAAARPRASLGSTLLPLMALGVLFLVLVARAALEYPEIVSAAQVDSAVPVEASSAL